MKKIKIFRERFLNILRLGEFNPTKRTSWILGYLFLFVVIWSLFSFPYGKLLSGNLDIQIEIGLPVNFLVLDLVEPENFPLRVSGFIIDFFIYLLIAYALD